MSRYIDAEKAIEALAKYEMYEARAEFPDASDDLEDWKELVIERLENVPSIEIVRCEDCMEYRKFATKTDELESDGFCLFNNFGVNAGDFCSDAERREDG